MDGKLFGCLAKADVLRQGYGRNKKYPLTGASYMHLHYNLIPQPYISELAQYYTLKVRKASFSSVTGIFQVGGAAQVEATIQLAPTPLFSRIKEIVDKLLEEEGITEADLRAKYDFHGSRSFCLDILEQNRKLLTQGTNKLTFTLLRYDDGWRVSQ